MVKKILEKIGKLRKEESGASMVMVALSLVVILGFTALAVDLGYAYTTKVEMQDACDLSALAAASSLPERAKTEMVAKEYAELNGFDEDDVEVNILDGGEKVEVKISKDLDTYFAGVIGYSKMPVSCKAVAMVGEKGAKDYAIFSGNGRFFNLNGDITIPNGDIHANGPGNINGTLNIPNGVIEVPSFDNKGSTGDYETHVDDKNIIDMPDYSEIINSRLTTVSADGYTVIDGDFMSSDYAKSHIRDRVLTIKSGEKIYAKSYLNIGSWLGVDQVVVEGTLKVDGIGIQVPLIVEGNMVIGGYPEFNDKTVINGHMLVEGGINFLKETEIGGTVVAGETINFSNKVVLDSATVVSDGSLIEFQGATVTDKYSNGGYSVFWGRGANTHININATVDIKALLYAPTGETIMNGGNVNIKGSMTANQVGSYNGNLTVELPKDDPDWPFGGKFQNNKKKAVAKLVE